MQSDELKDIVVAAMEDMKAQAVSVLDVRDRTSVMDLMIIASGTSTRHVRSIADNVMRQAAEAGVRALGSEGEQGSEWILVDLGDIVVHVMMPATRELYDLEGFWQAHPAARNVSGVARSGCL